MQSLDVISINIWQIIISLLNLVLLFFILKKFLYKPVKKAVAERKASIEAEYEKADGALKEAQSKKEDYENKLAAAESEAESIINEASKTADNVSEQKLKEAKEKADYMIRNARSVIELEQKKAASDMKREIAESASQLTEKLLEREINENDHKQLIDSFISKIGEEDD